MPEPFALSMPDARADGALRHVSVSAEQVTICRRYQGIAMRVIVPCTQYRGIVMRRVAQDGGVRHEVALLHRDAELTVPLGHDADAPGAAQNCERWAAWFDLPALRGASSADADLSIAAPKARRRSATLVNRRRRYALRRKMGFINQVFV